MRAIPAFLALVLLAACGRAGGEGEARPVAAVSLALARTGDIADTLTAYGAAEAAPGSERVLVAPVEAVLARILAPPGTRVAAGAPVAQLAPTAAGAAELARSRADAAAADAALARQKRLRAAGLAGDAEVEAAAAAAQIADAALAARAGQGLVLRAPQAGVVGAFSIEAGAVAPAGAAVVRLGDPARLRLRLGLEAGDARRVRPGAAATAAALAGGPDQAAWVVAVDPRLDPQTRQAAVWLEAPAGAFAPGEPVKGRIVLARRAGAVLVPRAAVLYEGDAPYLFIAERGVAHRQAVRLGASEGDRIEIVQGLAAGQSVVVEGATALDDGMAIRAVAPALSPAASSSGDGGAP